MRRISSVAAVVVGIGLLPAAERPLAAAGPAVAPMVQIPAGTYRPLYPDRSSRDGGKTVAATRRITVRSFAIDIYAVTNEAYLEFVRTNPRWRRSQVSRTFADSSYLRHWRGDLDLGDDAQARSPVVYVSWFAARAYLASQGKVLPTVDQWEYAAVADERRRDASGDPSFLERVRLWYGRPVVRPLPLVGTTPNNVYGVHDLHGLIWEWTLDFNSALVTGESRADSALDRTRYCGSGAVGAADFDDYAAFMRYAFRSSLQARYTVANLGFRGVSLPGRGRR